MKSRTTSLSCDLRPVTENFRKFGRHALLRVNIFFFQSEDRSMANPSFPPLILNRAFQRERRLCQVLKNSL